MEVRKLVSGFVQAQIKLRLMHVKQHTAKEKFLQIVAPRAVLVQVAFNTTTTSVVLIYFNDRMYTFYTRSQISNAYQLCPYEYVTCYLYINPLNFMIKNFIIRNTFVY